MNTSRSEIRTEIGSESRISTYSQVGKRANSTVNISGRSNSFSKLEGSLLFGKNKNMSLEELRRKVESLLDLNI